MKIFVRYIVGLIALTILVMSVSDFIFTLVYYNGIPRDKIRWINTDEIPDTLDYVLLGSSRCRSHLQPDIILENTGKIGLNLGISGAGAVEIKLLLLQVIKNISVKDVFIQVDDEFDHNGVSSVAIGAWMPYLREDIVYEELIKLDPKYFYYKYIPFYRYMISEPLTGIRNVNLILGGISIIDIREKGFSASTKIKQGYDSYNVQLVGKENEVYKEIMKICEISDINLFFYTAPFYNSTTDFNTLRKFLPNYKDFSRSITERRMFANLTHLNVNGSEVFTRIFIEAYYDDDKMVDGELE